MRLVTALAAQLRGELTAGSAEPGSKFTLLFPLEAARSFPASLRLPDKVVDRKKDDRRRLRR
jgi:hypothetical protein